MISAEARDLHRPETPDARRPAVLELLRQGLRPLDVAACLRIPVAEIMEAAGRDRGPERLASRGGPG